MEKGLNREEGRMHTKLKLSHPKIRGNRFPEVIGGAATSEAGQPMAYRGHTVRKAHKASELRWVSGSELS